MDVDGIVEVITALIGPVDPIAETHADRVRLENLKVLCGVSEVLIKKIDRVAHDNSGSHYASCAQAAKCANEFLDELGIEK